MKKLLIVALLAIIALTAAFLYFKLAVEGTIGPIAMVVVACAIAAAAFVFVTIVSFNRPLGRTMARLWLALASAFLSWVVLDFTAGAILIQSLSPPLVPDEYRHHRLVPNSYARLESRDFTYVQRVNSLGLRGKEVPLDAEPGVFRILMLGDSFTMGKGVEDNETFSVVLEERLNRDLSQCGRTVEILNAGVDGYAPILSYVQLTRELYRLKPKMIVLNLDMNDLVGEAVFRRQAIRGANGEIVGVASAGDSTLMETFRSWSERHLYFTRLLFLYLNELFDRRDIRTVSTANFEVVAHTLATDSRNREREWHDLFDSVSRIRSFAEGQGATFVLSTYPWAHQVNEREGIPGRYGFVPQNAVVSDRSLDIIADFAAANRIPFANQFPIFRGYQGNEPLYFSYDTHWTAAGHRVMALGLEGFLLERYRDAWCAH